MRRPVFVAGRGAVSAFGSGRGPLEEGVFAGRSAIAPRRRTSRYSAPTAVAAEFPADCLVGVDEFDLPAAAALRAAREALDEARVGDRSTLGLVLATTKGDLSGLVAEGRSFGLPQRLAVRVAEELGLGGVLSAVSSACSSGLAALALAGRRIASGEVERVLVVGTDVLTEFVLAGFGAMHLLDPDPCRPFDMGRRGLSLGEAAGALVLSAHERESVGFRLSAWGGANDACHVTGCDREGRGLALAVERALQQAAVAAADVDLVHLHGTGTRANDASESVALGRAFDGATADAFGSKAQTGHTLGASGVLESILVLAALARGGVPRNVGLLETDTDPRLRLAREWTPLRRAHTALKVASGFGGMQQAVLFEA